MTVQTNTNVASFNGNGVTQIFPIAFKFNNDTDLVVLLVDDATGSASLLTLNSDYTVSGEGDEEGGLINVVVAPASGKRLKVTRVVDILQLTDLRNQGKFFAEIHEDALDLLTMIAQQHESGINSSLRVAESDPEPARIPAVAQRANKILSFDAAGNPQVVAPVTDSSTELRQELASSSGSGLVGYDANETYAAGTAGSELSRLAAAVAQTGGAVVSLDSFAGATDQEKLTAAFAAARLNKVAIWLPARQLEVTETLVYDTTGLGYYQGLQLFGAGQLSTVFVNKINNAGVGGPVIRLTSGTASADQQHGGLISGVGFIQGGAGTDGHGIEYHGTWHQTFERLYADGLTGAALRCINLYGDSDSSAHVNISNTRFLYCKGGAWSGDGGTGGISVHSIRDLYAVNCGELSGAQVIIDGCAHFLMEQCSVTGQGIDAPNVPLVKIKNTNLRSRTITVRGGEYGNNGGTHFEIAAVNTAYFGGFRQVRRVGENNSTKGFDLLDGSSLYRNVHIGPIELAIDSATPAWTWMSLGTGVGGNFTIDPPNNDSFAAGNVYYAGGGASRVSIRDTENFEMVSGFVKRVRSSRGTPGTVNLDISTGKWQQVEFLSGGAYTVSVPSGVRDGREFDLTIINTVGATVSFSASMKVTGFNSSAIETSATFRYDETSALWKQIGGWSA
ncbi:MAG: hypothetical protein CML01_11620 [Pseudomonas sp.]|nr:hypothetical protein [Pseudomonas sp.]